MALNAPAPVPQVIPSSAPAHNCFIHSTTSKMYCGPDSYIETIISSTPGVLIPIGNEELNDEPLPKPELRMLEKRAKRKGTGGSYVDDNAAGRIAVTGFWVSIVMGWFVMGMM